MDAARPYFKDHIAVAMNLLEDDDVSNDIQAWEILRATLFHAGDEVNGVAVRSMEDSLRLEAENYGWVEKVENVREAMKNDEQDQVPAGKQDSVQQSTEANVIDITDDGADASRQPSDDQKETTKPLNETDKKDPEVSITELSIDIIANSDDEEPPPYHNDSTNEDKSPLTDNANPNPAEKAPIDPLWAPQPYIIGYCDGPCLRTFSTTDKGVHYCTHCYDIQICEPCYELFKKGTWLYKKCDVTHGFVFVPGPLRGLRARARGANGNAGKERIMVGGVVRDHGEWLEGIWREWGVRKEGKEGKGRCGELS